MNIWQLDKLILFIIFVIPGFISIKTYQLFFPSVTQKTSEKLIDAIAYSSFNYGVHFIPIILIEQHNVYQKAPIWYFLFYFFLIFIAPILWAIIYRIIRKSKLFQKNAPHPTSLPWDYVFSKQIPFWVKVVLKDGTQISGLYGYNSFSSSSPSKEQIYLEEVWITNDKGGFVRKKKETAGVIIVTDDISYLELREYQEQGETNV